MKIKLKRNNNLKKLLYSKKKKANKSRPRMKIRKNPRKRLKRRILLPRKPSWRGLKKKL